MSLIEYIQKDQNQKRKLFERILKETYLGTVDQISKFDKEFNAFMSRVQKSGLESIASSEAQPAEPASRTADTSIPTPTASKKPLLTYEIFKEAKKQNLTNAQILELYSLENPRSLAAYIGSYQRYVIGKSKGSLETKTEGATTSPENTPAENDTRPVLNLAAYISARKAGFSEKQILEKYQEHQLCAIGGFRMQYSKRMKESEKSGSLPVSKSGKSILGDYQTYKNLRGQGITDKEIWQTRRGEKKWQKANFKRNYEKYLPPVQAEKAQAIQSAPESPALSLPENPEQNPTQNL